jgi:SNF2-related domain/Tripartite tricarboxylate transporter family receptor
MNASELKPGIIVRGPVLPEPIEVLVVTPLGDVIKIVGAGQKTGQVHQRVLRLDQLQFLDATPEREPFDGDPARFRLGVEAARLGLAYEYDPYFSLSISRVDPLPHQLEAVYDYFMRLPRIRFLLADDPGAGKTIMAGLLLKELKIRGLVKRTLIVAPANLCFQWQRELKEKFRESFEVVRSDVLRANYGQNPWQEKHQVITSISWVSRIEDAKESLLRSRWDLVIVDEAHKMAAYSADKKTLAYKLGEALSTMTDHYLLMTATPHKGDPENFCLFLELLDRDIYGSVKSLEENRSPSLPNVPTFQEAGISGLVIDQRIGVFLPKGTSRGIAERLNAEINAALGDDKVRKSFADQAQEPAGGTADQYAGLVREDSEKYGRLVKELDVKVE